MNKRRLTKKKKPVEIPEDYVCVVNVLDTTDGAFRICKLFNIDYVLGDPLPGKTLDSHDLKACGIKGLYIHKDEVNGFREKRNEYISTGYRARKNLSVPPEQTCC